MSKYILPANFDLVLFIAYLHNFLLFVHTHCLFANRYFYLTFDLDCFTAIKGEFSYIYFKPNKVRRLEEKSRNFEYIYIVRNTY